MVEAMSARAPFCYIGRSIATVAPRPCLPQDRVDPRTAMALAAPDGSAVHAGPMATAAALAVRLAIAARLDDHRCAAVASIEAAG